MKKMLYIIAGIILLTGCVSKPPKQTPEELAEKRQATLNIYDDNRVAVRVPRPTRYPSLDFWSWNDKTSEALVYSTGTEYYNALDVIKITKDQKTYVMTAHLKNGVKKTFNEKDFSVFWCKANKQCSHDNSGAMKAIYEMDLHGTPKRDPRYDVKTGNDAKPYMMENEIVILDSTGYEALLKRVDSMHLRWQDVRKNEAERQNRIQEEMAAKERHINDEAEQMRRTIKIGTRTNCGDVFDVRPPMIGVQTMHGTQFIRITELYGPSANCRFANGKYVGR